MLANRNHKISYFDPHTAKFSDAYCVTCKNAFVTFLPVKHSAWGIVFIFQKYNFTIVLMLYAWSMLAQCLLVTQKNHTGKSKKLEQYH